MDVGFPIIAYEKGKSFREWGEFHGESYRSAIKEIVEIRRSLMLQKNPALESQLEQLAQEQWQFTRDYAPDIWEELDGIREGSGCTAAEIVILNNYTDFRDITFPDEGCSIVYKVEGGQYALAGQSWDMHRSAKDYVCVVSAPATEKSPASLTLSIVGSVGMLGYNSQELMLGVNNLNTVNAATGMLWPALVRQSLMHSDLDSCRRCITEAPIAGGRNYLLASKDYGECMEVAPGLYEVVNSADSGRGGSAFHTNHCLSDQMKDLENKKAVSSTTHERYALIEKKLPEVRDLQALRALLCDHEGFPKSICSHYESGLQDPAFTCGAVAADLCSHEYLLWRGCPELDKGYREYRFFLEKGEFFQPNLV